MKPAIFFSMMYLRGAEEVASEILRQTDVELLTAEPSTSILRNVGISCRSFDDFIPKEDEARLTDIGLHRMAAAVREMSGDAFWAEFPRIPPGAREQARELVLDTLQQEFFRILYTVEMVHRVASEFDLRAIVVSEDVLPISRSVVAAGRRLGIPSLHVMHGAPFGPVSPQPRIYADYVAVFSKTMRDNLERVLQVPRERICVTGNPAWDRLSDPLSETRRAELCQQDGLDPAQPVITYAMTDPGVWSSAYCRYPRIHLDNADAVVAAFGDLARRYPNWQFLLRPRPGAADGGFVDEYVQRARAGGWTLHIDRLPPYESVVRSDVVLSTVSNMSIEAVLLGKAAVNVVLEDTGAEIFREGFGEVFDAEDAILQAGSRDQVAAAVEGALCNEGTRSRLVAARPRTVMRMNGANDGLAAQRVAACVAEMMEGRRPPMPAPGSSACLDLPLARNLSAGAIVHPEPLPPNDRVFPVLRELKSSIRSGESILAPATNRFPRYGGLSTRRDGHVFDALPVIARVAGLDVESIVAAHADHGVALHETDTWILGLWAAEPRAGEEGNDTARQRAEALNAAGEEAFAAARLAQAEGQFRQAISMDPSFAIAHNNLGTVLHQQEDYEGAWGSVVRALQCDPGLESARHNLRALAEALKREQYAEAFCDWLDMAQSR